MQNLGLKFSLRPEPSDDVPAGLVIRTEPEAGTQVLRGDTIIIVYATEPTSSVVPDVVGKNVSEAADMLRESNLNFTIEGSPEVLALPENEQIVIITNPVSGTTVARKSTVKLYVGTQEDYQNGGTPTPTPPQAEIKIVINGSGTVTGGGMYDLDTQVTLTATPASGYRFDCWLDQYGNQVAVSNTYTFVVRESTTYTAVFVAAPKNNTPAPSDNNPMPTDDTPLSPTDPNPPVTPDNQDQRDPNNPFVG